MSNEEVMQGQVWEWSFENVVTFDTVDMLDVIKSFETRLSLIDYDADLKEVSLYSVQFNDVPQEDQFIEYSDLTPDNLKEWTLLKFANPEMGWPNGRTAWLENEKRKLRESLAQRRIQTYRTLPETIVEQ